MERNGRTPIVGWFIVVSTPFWMIWGYFYLKKPP